MRCGHGLSASAPPLGGLTLSEADGSAPERWKTGMRDFLTDEAGMKDDNGSADAQPG